MKKITSDFSELDSGSRRKFLQYAMSGAATILMVQMQGAAATQGRGKGWKQMSTKHQYAYVIDINKCIGWGGCVRACGQENNVPEGVFRTWVERYVLTEDGVYVDSPKGGAEGFEPVAWKFRKRHSVPFLCQKCVTTARIHLVYKSARSEQPISHPKVSSWLITITVLVVPTACRPVLMERGSLIPRNMYPTNVPGVITG